jgi:hypothetical protein
MNNNAIQKSTTSKMYVAHSVNQEKVKKEAAKETKPAQSNSAPQPQPYQYTSKSYYYDSMGGGYQGL